MKKTLKLLTTLICLFFILGVTSYAEEPTEPRADGAPLTSPDSDAPATDTEDTSSDPEVEPHPTDGSALTSVYTTLVSHSTELFSALTLIGSVILAFAYKKGLLPLLSGALGKMSGGISGIRESVKTISEERIAESEETKKVISSIEATLESVARVSETLSEGIGALDSRLLALESKKDGEGHTREILAAQIDMLYEIFMSSSLPQYSKDAVAKRIGKMKESLLPGGEGDDA